MVCCPMNPFLCIFSNENIPLRSDQNKTEPGVHADYFMQINSLLKTFILVELPTCLKIYRFSER
jgi:hypothetical protein